MFNEGCATGVTPYSNSNGNSSTANAGSAISYIPETVWIESSSSGLGAGGGGASAYFSKPSWQVGNGVPSDSSRDVPDVSFNAAAVHDGYLFCSQGSCTNGFRNAAGNLNVVGGTFVAAPTLAGVFALLEQQLGGGTANRIGNANPMIYGLASIDTSAFHDITAGNNNSPCQQGTTNCPNGGTIGYNATPGYDLATGWGSIDVYNFVTKWSSATPTGIPTPTPPKAISSTTVTTAGALCSNSSGSVSLYHRSRQWQRHQHCQPPDWLRPDSSSTTLQSPAPPARRRLAVETQPSRSLPLRSPRAATPSAPSI